VKVVLLKKEELLTMANDKLQKVCDALAKAQTTLAQRETALTAVQA
jgi:hypothetical protein